MSPVCMWSVLKLLFWLFVPHSSHPHFRHSIILSFSFLCPVFPSPAATAADSVCTCHSVLNGLWLYPSQEWLRTDTWLSQSAIRLKLCKASVCHCVLSVVNQSLWLHWIGFIHVLWYEEKWLHMRKVLVKLLEPRLFYPEDSRHRYLINCY